MPGKASEASRIERPEDLLHEADVPAMCDELQAVAFPVARFRGGHGLLRVTSRRRKYYSDQKLGQACAARSPSFTGKANPKTIQTFAKP